MSVPVAVVVDDCVIVMSPGSVMSQAYAIVVEPLTVPLVTAPAGVATARHAAAAKSFFILRNFLSMLLAVKMQPLLNKRYALL